MTEAKTISGRELPSWLTWLKYLPENYCLSDMRWQLYPTGHGYMYTHAQYVKKHIPYYLNVLNITTLNIYSCKKPILNLPFLPHICISELDQHWFSQCLVAYFAPSHDLNQCWFIVFWTLRNKPQWNCNKNTKLLIKTNAYEYSVWEMAVILSNGEMS